MIILTPYIIREGIPFFEEELVECIFILTLLILGAVVDHFYQKEIAIQNKKMIDVWKHVGKTNLFTERIKELLADINIYPKNKKDIQHLFAEMASRIMGLDDYTYVLFRIIDKKNFHTLSEYLKIRELGFSKPIKIGNKTICKKSEDEKSNVISSTVNEFNIKVFCVISKNDISDVNRILIQKILNDLALYYIVFKKYM